MLKREQTKALVDIASKRVSTLAQRSLLWLIRLSNQEKLCRLRGAWQASAQHTSSTPPNFRSDRAVPPGQQIMMALQPMIPVGVARCQGHQIRGIRVPPVITAERSWLVSNALNDKLVQERFISAHLLRLHGLGTATYSVGCAAAVSMSAGRNVGLERKRPSSSSAAPGSLKENPPCKVSRWAYP